MKLGNTAAGCRRKKAGTTAIVLGVVLVAVWLTRCLFQNTRKRWVDTDESLVAELEAWNRASSQAMWRDLEAAESSSLIWKDGPDWPRIAY
jgi:hypothetical protein